jgi:predicted kinase
VKIWSIFVAFLENMNFTIFNASDVRVKQQTKCREIANFYENADVI